MADDLMDSEQYEEIPDDTQDQFIAEQSGGTPPPPNADRPVHYEDTDESPRPRASRREPVTGPAPEGDLRQTVEQLRSQFNEVTNMLRGYADSRVPLHPQEPEFLQRPTNQWSADDLRVYAEYLAQANAARSTAESEWRGRFSAEQMGEGRDYGNLVEKYVFNNPDIRGDQMSLNFVRGLDPENRYGLAVLHYLRERAGNDPVRFYRDLFNSLGARAAGQRDLQNSVNRAQRNTHMRVISGGRSGGENVRRNYWSGSDDDFRKLIPA